MNPQEFTSRKVPTALDYQGIDKVVASRRSIIRLDPINGSTFNPGQIVKFDIPNALPFFDGGRPYLTFIGTASGGTTPCFSNGISTIFQQLRVQYGSEELENITNYGTLIQLFTNTFSSANFQSTVGVYSGYNSQANRRTNATGFRYCMPAFSGFAQNDFPSVSKMIPTCLNNSVLRYEFTLDSALNALENAGGTSGYQITDTAMIIECVSVADSWLREFRAKAAAYPLGIAYTTFNNYTNTMAAGQTAASLTIADKSRYVDAVFNVMRDQASLSSQSATGKYETFNYNALTTYQMQINGGYVPDQPVRTDNGSEGVFELLKLYQWPINFANLQGDVLPAAAWQTNKCVVAVSLEAFPYEQSIITGSDFQNATGQMILKLTFGSGLGSVQQLDSWVMHDRILIYEPNTMRLVR